IPGEISEITSCAVKLIRTIPSASDACGFFGTEFGFAPISKIFSKRFLYLKKSIIFANGIEGGSPPGACECIKAGIAKSGGYVLIFFVYWFGSCEVMQLTYYTLRLLCCQAVLTTLIMETYKKNWFKYLVGFIACLLIRLIPFLPPNIHQ